MTEELKHCEDCLAYYTGEHVCPPWLKAIIKAKKRDWQSDREDYRDGKMKPQCKYCGYEYTDPKYCSVSGRTADKHKWL